MQEKYFSELINHYRMMDKSNSELFNKNICDIIVKLIKKEFSGNFSFLKNKKYNNCNYLLNEINNISVYDNSEVYLKNMMKIIELHLLDCFGKHNINFEDKYSICLQSIHVFLLNRLKELESKKMSFLYNTSEPKFSLERIGRNTDEYNSIKESIDYCIKNNPEITPLQEDARMEKAKLIYVNPKSSDVAKKNAERRLRENMTDILPPRSLPIRIQNISKNVNPPLELIYEDFKKKFKNDVSKNLKLKADIETNFNKLSLVNKNQVVLDPLFAEVYLWHGISARSYKRTLENGFRPDLGGNYGTPENPIYGYSGQGSYFTDNFSKMMSYTSCSNCGDFECDCTMMGSRKKFPRYAILTKCLLGNIYHRRHVNELINNIRHISRLKDIFSNRKFRQETFDVKDPNFHSIYVAGLDATRNPFKLGNSANEFLIKNYKQIFPAYLVEFELLNEEAIGNRFLASN